MMHNRLLGSFISLLVTNVLFSGVPETITAVPPNYPVLARLARVSGVVDIEVSLNQDGSVKEILTKPTTRQSVPAQLFVCSADAARKWKFKPGTQSPVQLSFFYHLYPVGTSKETLKSELVSSTIMIVKAPIADAETDPAINS
jgi:hypothetical protein